MPGWERQAPDPLAQARGPVERRPVRAVRMQGPVAQLQELEVQARAPAAAARSSVVRKPAELTNTASSLAVEERRPSAL